MHTPSRSSCFLPESNHPSRYRLLRPDRSDVLSTIRGGYVSRPIVWDWLGLGGYGVDDQSISAARQVDESSSHTTTTASLACSPIRSPILLHPTPRRCCLRLQPRLSIHSATDAPPARFLFPSKRLPSGQILSYLSMGVYLEKLVKNPSEIDLSDDDSMCGTFTVHCVSGQ